MTNPIDFLLTRRSVLAPNLTEPGPNSEELETILTAATRVPDHKKLAPWRFIVFADQARAEFGQILKQTYAQNEPDAGEIRLETEAGRFLRTPMVIAVISSPVEKPGVPEWEQTLSAGAVCISLLNAASALGYSGQWITEWYAFDTKIHKEIGLTEAEKVAGFIYLGTASAPPKERDRPDISNLTTYWQK